MQTATPFFTVVSCYVTLETSTKDKSWAALSLVLNSMVGSDREKKNASLRDGTLMEKSLIKVALLLALASTTATIQSIIHLEKIMPQYKDIFTYESVDLAADQDSNTIFHHCVMLRDFGELKKEQVLGNIVVSMKLYAWTNHKTEGSEWEAWDLEQEEFA